MTHLKSLAFTGHRMEKLPFTENSPGGVWLKQAMLDVVLEKAASGYAIFLSGYAYGCDLFFAEAVLTAKRTYPDIQLIACVPFPGQARSWSEDWKKRYAELLRRADAKVQLFDHYTRGCFLARDRYMVDASTEVLAAYNGKHEGGTFYTMKYAYSKGKAITILDVNTLTQKLIPPKG